MEERLWATISKREDAGLKPGYMGEARQAKSRFLTPPKCGGFGMTTRRYQGALLEGAKRDSSRKKARDAEQ